VAAGMALARRHVGAGGRGVCHRGIAHAVGELWFGNHALPAGAVAIVPVVVSR
jgi:hypothetical protein